MQLERARELASLLDDSRLSEGPSRAPGYSASALPVRSARARERACTLSACLCECLRARGSFYLAPQAQTSGMPLICSVLSFPVCRCHHQRQGRCQLRERNPQTSLSSRFLLSSPRNCKFVPLCFVLNPRYLHSFCSLLLLASLISKVPTC